MNFRNGEISYSTWICYSSFTPTTDSRKFQSCERAKFDPIFVPPYVTNTSASFLSLTLGVFLNTSMYRTVKLGNELSKTIIASANNMSSFMVDYRNHKIFTLIFSWFEFMHGHIMNTAGRDILFKIKFVKMYSLMWVKGDLLNSAKALVLWVFK